MRTKCEQRWLIPNFHQLNFLTCASTTAKRCGIRRATSWSMRNAENGDRERLASQPLHQVLNEEPCRFRVDRVAIGAQTSHSGGSAISQRE